MIPLNPTMALAKNLLSDPSSRLADQVDLEIERARREQARRDITRGHLRHRMRQAYADSTQGQVATTHDAIMERATQEAEARRAIEALVAELVEGAPVEGDLRTALGLPGDTAPDAGEDDSPEEAPMKQSSPFELDPRRAALVAHRVAEDHERRLLKAAAARAHTVQLTGAGRYKISESEGENPITNATLVGYMDDASSPLTEAYIEETPPTWADRGRRAAIGALAGGGTGALAGLGFKMLSPRLASRIRHPRLQGLARIVGQLGSNQALPFIGGAMGSVLGGGAGGLSNRTLTNVYDPNSGAPLDDLVSERAQDLAQRLEPGMQPYNYSVAGSDSASLRGMDRPPSVAWAADLDEAIAEDPNLALALGHR